MTDKPANTRELYDLLTGTPDLCGRLSIPNERELRWDLWEGYCLSMGVNRIETTLILQRTGKFPWQITHWHTDNDEILEELRSIGTKGSLLIVRRGWFGESVEYFGPNEECPKRATRRGLFHRPLILKAQ